LRKRGEGSPSAMNLIGGEGQKNSEGLEAQPKKKRTPELKSYPSKGG